MPGKFGGLSFFSYLCSVFRKGGQPLADTQLIPFIHILNTHTTMNKTVKLVLQIISYVITAILGAFGGAQL